MNLNKVLNKIIRIMNFKGYSIVLECLKFIESNLETIDNKFQLENNLLLQILLFLKDWFSTHSMIP